MRRVTINDIARELDISKSTVARALTHQEHVSPATRERVEALAKQLGYKRNELAAGLSRHSSRTIGIVVPELITPFYVTVISSIQQRLYPEGYRVVITQSAEDADTEFHNLRLLEDYLVDGIILCLSHPEKNFPECERLRRSGLPLVFFNRKLPQPNVTQVVTDDYIRSFFIVEHLIRQGKRRILHLQGPARIPNSAERRKGYADALQKFRIPWDASLAVLSETSMESGYQATERALEAIPGIDAIFGFTDTVAIGAMRCLQNRQIRIPQDIAVAGFSGTMLSTLVSPPLTTVVLPLEDMGRQAAELMLRKIRYPEVADETVELKGELVLRSSTGWL